MRHLATFSKHKVYPIWLLWRKGGGGVATFWSLALADGLVHSEHFQLQHEAAIEKMVEADQERSGYARHFS